ncbi:conserved hypothetical protein [Histoplasma capsulatum var. duboisii H88]|uniref:Uncharacterized protein n=1 Tax=Ajellomyces capsulatus (strain H88) TaxID=544711 RepID=F0UL55_AJEC8|nr:conserved hypothetical protein [Histoplasma capsulatum var. duboisii H88]
MSPGRWLADRVLIPPDLVIDYSKCFGAEPTTTTVGATIASWKRLTDKVDTEQHIPSAILITLSQPGPEIIESQNQPLPFVTLRRANLTETNQGRYDIELKWASQWDASGGNPCQITKLVAIMAWVEGNVKLLPFEEEGGSKRGRGACWGFNHSQVQDHITTSTWLEQRGRMCSRLLFAGPRNWAQKYVGKPRQEYLATKVAKGVLHELSPFLAPGSQTRLYYDTINR